MRKFAILLLLATACSCFKKSADNKPLPKTTAEKSLADKSTNRDRAKKVFQTQRERYRGRVEHSQKARADAHLKPNTAFRTAIGAVACDGVFHWVNVPGMNCIDGSPSGFQYLCPVGNSATSPLVVYGWGNGSCWYGDGCDCQPDPMTGTCTGANATLFSGIYTIAQSDDGLSLAASSFTGPSIHGGPVAVIVGPNSPFAGNNIVGAQNCGGDLWSGSIPFTKLKKDSDGQKITVSFNGYASMGAFLTQVQSLFPNPSRLAFWGDSSSGFGFDCSLQRSRNLWPSANMYSMSDAGGNFFVTTVETSLISSVFSTWGSAFQVLNHAISKTCPLDPALTNPDQFVFSMSSYNRKYLPSVRKSFSDDYFDAILTAFASIMDLAPDKSYTDGLVQGNASVIVNANATDNTNLQPYATALTNDDVQNFGIFNIPLFAGQTLDTGTCVTPGSSNHGQNYLRLFDPTGAQIASDNASCPGGGAHINLPAAALTGQYTLRLGCSSNTLCSGTVAAHVTGATNITYSPLTAPAPYTTSNSNNDTVNFKTASVYLVEGQTIDLGTCGVDNSIAIGDTYLRLFNPSSVQVAFNDDACGPGGKGSRLQYTVPPGGRGLYTIRQGCHLNLSCGGFTAFYVIGPTLYKSYIHGTLSPEDGFCHAEREQDGNDPASCDYNVMTQSGTNFNDFVRGWMEVPAFIPNWINVQ